MSRLAPIALMLGTTLAAGVLLACGGGDDAATTDPATGTADAAGGRSPETTATATSSSSGSGAGTATDGRAALAETMKRLEQSTYYVVYAMTGTYDGGEISGEFAIATKPPKQFFSIKQSSAEGGFGVAVVDNGESSYFCLAGSEGAPGGGCFKGDSAGDALGGATPFLHVEDELRAMALDGQAEVKNLPGKRVAGRDANCFEVTDDTGTSTVCVAKDDGFLLSLDGNFDGGHISLELKDYSDNPSDSLFEPPYPVQASPFSFGE